MGYSHKNKKMQGIKTHNYFSVPVHIDGMEKSIFKFSLFEVHIWKEKNMYVVWD